MAKYGAGPVLPISEPGIPNPPKRTPPTRMLRIGGETIVNDVYCLVRLMTATVVVTSDETATITCATRRKVSM